MAVKSWRSSRISPESWSTSYLLRLPFGTSTKTSNSIGYPSLVLGRPARRVPSVVRADQAILGSSEQGGSANGDAARRRAGWGRERDRARRQLPQVLQRRGPQRRRD